MAVYNPWDAPQEGLGPGNWSPYAAPRTGEVRAFTPPAGGYFDYFGGLGDLGLGALGDNPAVAYQHVAGQVARPQSNYQQYFLQQYGRLHNAYDYQGLQYPNRTWTDFLNQYAPMLSTEFAGLSAKQRGEDQGQFAWGGGRWQ